MVRPYRSERPTVGSCARADESSIRRNQIDQGSVKKSRYVAESRYLGLCRAARVGRKRSESEVKRSEVAGGGSGRKVRWHRLPYRSDYVIVLMRLRGPGQMYICTEYLGSRNTRGISSMNNGMVLFTQYNTKGSLSTLDFF